MRVFFHKNFDKDFKKLKASEKAKFTQRLREFRRDEFNPILNNHPLKGKYQGLKSINITGDLRAIYQKRGTTVFFVAIDIHSNLYR
jgi:addiction module RelE/StbE family toxin